MHGVQILPSASAPARPGGDHANAAATYDEWAPPPHVADDVACLWWSSFGDRSPILPDGCLDIVVTPDRAVVAGPDTRAWTSSIPVGMVIHGIRFRPGRAPRILGVPADDLRDQRVDLADLWGSAAARQVVDQVNTDPCRFAPLVTERRKLVAPEGDCEIDHAVRTLLAGDARLGEVLSGVSLSERQLRRRFTARVGYGPALFVRVVRMLRIRRLARIAPAASLADLAATTGYADQSHLARDCRDLAGMSATSLLRRPAPNSATEHVA
ncbi:helix-turn-helix domain-containing protein [Actinopolymorpha sp. B11F2]|uniref:helix-turn-helix domain-containing protein n=1 Tax=Actinopolymorpha sp. B11F2 TaxID=3160862 RepID=UPI0032E4598B